MPTYKFTSAEETHVLVKEDNGNVVTINERSPLWAKMIADGIVPDAWADPRTPQEIYDEEVLAPLDTQVLKEAARMVEDFYDALEGNLPQSMKNKHGPLMLARKAARAARP